MTISSSDTEGPNKRRKTKDHNGHVDNEQQDMKMHNIYGVLPEGNALIQDAVKDCRNSGLGHLSILPDELLTMIFSELEPRDLVRAQATSHAFFAWCACIEGLWKALLLQKTNGYLPPWKGTWRRTYLLWNKSKLSDKELDSLPSDSVRLEGIYSDVLYLPYRCSAFDANHIFKKNNNIPHTDGSQIEQLAGTPIILKNLMNEWKAWNNESTRWTISSLKERFPNVKYQAESTQTRMQEYELYMNNCLNDESPVYMFDADYVEKTAHATNEMDGLGLDFHVPKLFGQDLLDYMDEDDRPDFRWIIIGPSRSGSSWHQDPNGTSAWNAVIQGSKGWIMFPPEITPPGVFVTEDRAQVEAPLSVAEWFLSYYDQAISEYGSKAKDLNKRGKMRQGVCKAGEIFYVPSGWWHLVINLQDSIAITQNYVSKREVGHVFDFMKNRHDQVSGFGRGKRRKARMQKAQNVPALEDECDESGQQEQGQSVFERFSNAVKVHDPATYEHAIKEMEQIEASSSANNKNKVSIWDQLMASSEPKTENGEKEEDQNKNVSISNGFSFSFAIDSE